jgi:hypothetical protein
VDRMVAEAAQQLGGLHILVNSGSAPGGSATATGPIETVIDEDLLQDFNVKGVQPRKSRYFSPLEDNGAAPGGTSLGGAPKPADVVWTGGGRLRASRQDTSRACRNFGSDSVWNG